MNFARPLYVTQTDRSLLQPRRSLAGKALGALFTTTLLSVTVLERFGLNFGSYSLNACLIALYLLLVVAALTGQLALSNTRTIIYGAAIGAASTTFYINAYFAHGDASSASSLLLLVVTYAPFIFLVRPSVDGGESVDTALSRFVNISLFVAIAGIAQFYAQFVIHDGWLFDFTPWVPPSLQGPSGFNTVIRVGSYYKANGFFGREPSGFSFLMALGLLAEWPTRRRPWVLICHGLGLLLSYSGTGILTLVIAALFPIRRNTVVHVLALAIAAALVFWVFGDLLNLSFTLQRVFEFGSERSSGYIRYVAPFRLLLDTWSSEPWSLWLGHGPGTIARAQEGAFFYGLRAYEFHDPTWAKLLFEYGIVGFILFVTLFVVVVNHPGVPVPIRVVLFCSWLLMGGHLLSPEHDVLTLALVGLMPRSRLRAAARRDQAAPPIPPATKAHVLYEEGPAHG